MTERQILPADLNSLRELSVDQLFQQHLVRLIQQLYSSYTSQVNQAKEDLHTLVGEKYRDLIRIAENVDTMSSESSQVNGLLSDLSYQPSRLAQFGACAVTRFDSKVRMAKAKQARAQLQTTILNNIINNQIIGFDLKLGTDSISTTFDLVHFAKLYYSVSAVFQTTLISHPHILARFTKLRAHFLHYLEQKLASDSSNISMGDLDKSNLILKSPSTWVDMDSLDFFEDPLGEEEFEETIEWDHNGFPLSGFLSQSVPILNILIAYAIMTSDQTGMLSSKKLADRFLSLRFHYFSDQLSSLLASSHDSLQNVNFSAIFSFLEGTCLVVRKYFMGDGTCDIMSRLADLEAWNPADLLGFHHWMKSQQVSLAVGEFRELPNDYLSGDNSHLNQFSAYLLTFCSNLIETVSKKQDVDPTHKLQLLHNLIASLRKVEILCARMDAKSMAVTLSAQTQLVPTFLSRTLQSVQLLIQNQQNLLTTQLVEFAKDIPLPSSNQEPFTLEFVSVIDNNVSEYLKTVIDVASQNDPLQSHGTNDSLQCKLKQWFARQRALLCLLSPKSDVRTRFQDINSRKYRNLLQFESWEGFSFETLYSEFDKVLGALETSLIQKISEFKKAISAHFKEKLSQLNGEDIFLELNILYIIRKNLCALQLSPGSAIEQNEVETLFEKLLNNVFAKQNLIPNAAFNNPLVITSILDESSISFGPHMRLYSLMNQLATNMFASSLLSESELYALYLDDQFKQEYVKVKNKWILENLVNLIDFDELPLQKQTQINLDSKANCKEEGVSGDESSILISAPPDDKSAKSVHELISQCRQILANVAFVLQFTSSDRITIDNKEISVIVKKLLTAGAPNFLDDSIVESLLRGVSNFYESGKETFMPLLLN